MPTQSEKLLEYHHLTSRLYSLNQQIESQRSRARAHERHLASLGTQIEQMRDQIRKAQAMAGEADLELKTRDANLEKLRTQLNQSKTNKEYTALLREISTFKADSGKVEENALRRMNDVDDLKKKLSGMEQQSAQERKRVEDLQSQAKGREAELAGQVAELVSRRDAAAVGLPADVLMQFNRIAEAHEGEAMAPIVKAHPKREEYICGGCNMGVTLEQVNSLRSRDDVQICNCCGRLLYLDESARS